MIKNKIMSAIPINASGCRRSDRQKRADGSGVFDGSFSIATLALNGNPSHDGIVQRRIVQLA
jgi:hypothetical protein